MPDYREKFLFWICVLVWWQIISQEQFIGDVIPRTTFCYHYGFSKKKTNFQLSLHKKQLHTKWVNNCLVISLLADYLFKTENRLQMHILMVKRASAENRLNGIKCMFGALNSIIVFHSFCVEFIFILSPMQEKKNTLRMINLQNIELKLTCVWDNISFMIKLS